MMRYLPIDSGRFASGLVVFDDELAGAGGPSPRSPAVGCGQATVASWGPRPVDDDDWAVCGDAEVDPVEGDCAEDESAGDRDVAVGSDERGGSLIVVSRSLRRSIGKVKLPYCSRYSRKCDLSAPPRILFHPASRENGMPAA